MKSYRSLLLAPCVLAFGFVSASGAVRLPAILSDNMVLQQGMQVPIWGWADAGEKVTVTAGAQTKSAQAAADGKWMVKLDPMQPGDPLTINIVGSNTITLKNVLVGEVWICSGQSNMELGIGLAEDAETEIPKANYPEIRLFGVPKLIALKPKEEMGAVPEKHPLEGAWRVCTPENLKADGDWHGFSAVGYFFGRDLNLALKVPIGLIHTSWGGSPAQAWISEEGLKQVPELAEYVRKIEELHSNLPALKEEYEKITLPKWEAADAKWKADDAAAQIKSVGEDAPAKPALTREPTKPLPPDGSPNIPTALNSGMLQPIVPYAIRGVVWYQGEANSHNPEQYRALLPTLITDWRKSFGEGDFPFLIVQLPNFMGRPTDPAGNWPILRDAQSRSLSLPNTGMAVTIDLGDEKNIHPKDKADVGYRLMLAAEHLAYGNEVVYSGPVYDRMEIEGSAIRLHFKNVGLALQIGVSPRVKDGKPADYLVGFLIAGEDRRFFSADAKIDGDAIVVTSASVEKPVAVRYAWADNPECNLYNKEKLPASPFRTDDWGPVPIAPKKQ